MREPNDYLLLGVYRDVTQSAEGVETLRRLGVDNDRIVPIWPHSVPLRAIGRPRPRDRLALITAIGAGIGLLLGIFMMVGTTNLYPLDVGGQPLVPGPPSLVIVYEYTLLGTLTTVFIAFALMIRTPPQWRYVWDAELTEDSFGVLAGVTSRQLDRAAASLAETGAYSVHRLDESGFRYRLRNLLSRGIGYGFWLGGIIGGLFAIAILCVFAYSVILWIYPDQMVTQQSVGYLEGPRLAAPTEAVPIQGPVLIDGQPATEPLPETAVSRERGATLFRIHCYMCHGNEGRGNGPLASYYQPPPANFRGPVVQSLPPEEIFRVITLGRGLMPSVSEGLTVGDIWDIITIVKPAPAVSPTGAPS